jgi:hypothetical protein
MAALDTTTTTINLFTNKAIDSIATSSLTTVSTQSVNTDWQLFVLVIAVVSFVFFQPQIFGSTLDEFYRSCFRYKFKIPGGKSEIKDSRLAPPRLIWFDTIWMLVHTCLSIAVIYYVYNFKLPSVGEESKFAGIEYSIVTMVLLEKLWRKLFWNYHFSRTAQCISGIALLFTCGFSIGLLIMYGIVGSWVSFGLMFLVVPWYLIVLWWHSFICYCYWSKTAHCKCHFPGDHHRHHHKKSRGTNTQSGDFTATAVNNDEDVTTKQRKRSSNK